jgi:hypothetical protein
MMQLRSSASHWPASHLVTIPWRLAVSRSQTFERRLGIFIQRIAGGPARETVQ